MSTARQTLCRSYYEYTGDMLPKEEDAAIDASTAAVVSTVGNVLLIVPVYMSEYQ